MKPVKILLSLLLLTAGATSSAQIAVLDSSFGHNGITEYNEDNWSHLSVKNIVVQPDDNVLYTFYRADELGGSNMTLKRLLANGEVDNDFGINGEVHTLKGSYNGNLALQRDGKILVATISACRVGACKLDPSDVVDVVHLERLMPDGSPDINFGNNGVIDIETPESSTEVAAIIQKEKGNILVAISKYGLFEFLPNGQPNKNFGNNGHSTPQSVYDRGLTDVIVLPGNRAIAASVYRKPDNTYSSCLILYTPQGNIDSSVGGNGILLNNNNGKQVDKMALSVFRGDKLLQYLNDGASDALYLYNKTGNLEPGFGNGGKVVLNDNTFSSPKLMAVQPNQKIVLYLYSKKKFARYLADGSLDLSFGNNGYLDIPGTMENVGSLISEKTTMLVGGSKIIFDEETGEQNNYSMIAKYKPCYTCPAASSPYSRHTEKLLPPIAVLHSMQVFPNPARGKTTIKLNGTANIYITDASGKTVLRKTIINQGEIMLTNLPAGTYYVTEVARGIRQKLIVVK